MQDFATLSRLAPFEGLCLTAQDLQDEQTYHRRNLMRHTLYLHGHGIVQGLQVQLEQRQKRYVAVLQAGYGITRLGQGVALTEPKAVPLEVPKQDGEYILWLFHVEESDGESMRPRFDTTENLSARVTEYCRPRLHSADEDHDDAVAIARINVRLGRMVQVFLPLPRAGHRVRAAESYLKPRVVEFIDLSRKVQRNLFRTALLKEMTLSVLSFNSALASSQFLLIEEGTSDRVLYRTASTLIAYAHDYFEDMPSTTDRIQKFKGFVRQVHAAIPAEQQGEEVWVKWFEKFERLLQPLKKISDELEKTVEAQR